MMLIMVGGMLLAWAAFVWLYAPDGGAHRYLWSRERRNRKYY